MSAATRSSRDLSSSEESGSQAVKAQQRLRELILTGELAAGSRIAELALVELLGVSRTPIRAALMRLEQEGLAVRGSRFTFATGRLVLASRAGRILPIAAASLSPAGVPSKTMQPWPISRQRCETTLDGTASARNLILVGDNRGRIEGVDVFGKNFTLMANDRDDVCGTERTCGG